MTDNINEERTREAKALGVAFARINQKNIDHGVTGLFFQPHKFARTLIEYAEQANKQDFEERFAEFPKINFILARRHHYVGKVSNGNIELGQRLVEFRKRRELKKAKIKHRQFQTTRVMNRLKMINRDIQRVMELIEIEET